MTEVDASVASMVNAALDKDRPLRANLEATQLTAKPLPH